MEAQGQNPSFLVQPTATLTDSGDRPALSQLEPCKLPGKASGEGKAGGTSAYLFYFPPEEKKKKLLTEGDYAA